ncbi:MAG: putative DNA-binding domain-containing protein [Proteobacteria bacterium]|nr:putative DNA-binding domain-containing protein [Pseudomonadota bacterium]
MPTLAERQREFAEALLDPRRAVPEGCVGPHQVPDEQRFGVYRNNVMVSLIEALRDSYVAVARLVGEDCFTALARFYAAQHPPCSPIMLEYGATFPQFLRDFEPLASLPYLFDVARIERGWLEAYHAPDVASLDLDELGGVVAQRAGEIRLKVHPSMRIIRSPYPALTIWRMNIANGVPAPVDLDAGGEDVLILRPEADVEVRQMPPGAAPLLDALARGETLIEASQAALSRDATFDLSSHLIALLESGLIVGVVRSP